MARFPQIVDPVNLDSLLRATRLRAAFWAVEHALLTRTVRRARGLPQTPAEQPRAVEPDWVPAAAEPEDRLRVLRWVFSRGVERLTCELALSDDDACYELRTTPATTPASRSVERFTDVTAAFQRQSALEGSLVADGWSLEAYGSLVVERTRSKTA